MVPESFLGFINYFDQIAAQHKLIEGFTHGPAMRLATKSRSGIKYPQLWLETPDCKVSDNGAGATMENNNCAFIILINGNKTAEQQDQTWHITKEIYTDVLSRMRKDARSGGFEFDLNSVKIDPINSIFVDNDYGWRVEFTRSTFLDLCYHPDRWNDE